MAHTAVSIISVMSLWVMFLSSIRFSINMGLMLKPLGRAAFRTLWWRMDERDYTREKVAAMDEIQLRLAIAMTTPWSAVLAILGSVLMGSAYSFGSSGNILVLIGRHPEAWQQTDRMLDWVAATSACVGMAMVLAALSRRRRISAIISTGFAITGLGIGVVSAMYV
jgi:hypothetical protein